ncbi:MAG: hypothetical protein J2P44_08520, partial [Candidatus Dormibacteraeota bacterium]|nr:hypothetical protein [Candidatus Dormibacteraeota bacterium]
TCAGPPVDVFANVPLGGGPPPTATSPGFTTTAVGTYRWIAIYSGDPNNEPISSLCQEEPVTTTRAAPTISTTQSPGGVVGTSISDTATVSGGDNPTGSDSFELFGPGDDNCSGPAVFVRIVPLTGTTATSPSFTTTAAGTYHWIAVYLGDTNNQPASSGCQDEPVVTTQASPTISTTPSPGGEVGTSLSDLATLTGAFNPTGHITFELFGPDDPTCQLKPVFTSTVSLQGIGATSGSFPTTTVGTYRWIDIYSGDDNNASVSSGCQDEPVTTTQAKPVLGTTPSPGGVVGAKISDLATVSGGFAPTGSVTFELFGPDDPTCTGTPVHTFTDIPLSGGPPSAASGSFATTTAGTYRWIGIYSGDDDNASVSSGCQEEPVTVDKASPAVVTVPSSGGPAGTAISDSAVLVRASSDPTGTVSFSLFGPGDPHCTTDLVHGSAAFKDLPFTSPKVVSGSFTATTSGTYQWVVTYSGDANNNTAGGSCGDPTEQVAITAGPGPRPGPGPGPAPGPGVTAPPSIPGLPSTGYGGGGWPLLLAGPLVAGLGGLLLLVGRRRRKRGRAG